MNNRQMLDTTIAALATPPGIGGLSVIRLSGPDAIAIADKCFSGKRKIADTPSHTVLYGNFIHKGDLVDTVTATVFLAPNSYTGENTVEFGCHGSAVVSEQVVSALMEQGAALAGPGEFTRRAFLNGKLDLTQVEAVADLIHSLSVPGARTAARQLAGGFTARLALFRKDLIDVAGLLELELDFSEEDLQLIDRGIIEERISAARLFCLGLADTQRSSEILRSGYHVGIAGYPNSGKSTLFNSLLNRRRAIVSEIAGTTRDYIEEGLYIKDIALRLVDTAGLRETSDIIEIEGIRLVESVLERSDLIIVLNDNSEGIGNSDSLAESIREKYPETEVLLVHNKTDLVPCPDSRMLGISAKDDTGIEHLRQLIYDRAKADTERVSDALINRRHANLLKEAATALEAAASALKDGMENEIIAIDIRRAGSVIGEITGDAWNEDVLNSVFSRFCIGK